MLLHQFGEHFVFAVQLRFELLDSVSFSALLAALGAVKCGSSGFPVGNGVKVESAKPKPDHDFEPLSIPKSASRVLDGLNF